MQRMRMRTLVKDVMSIRLVCARAETPLQEIVRMLVRGRIGGVPVVDDEGRVRGMVSESDLQPFGEPRPRPATVARDIMTAPVVTLTEQDSVPEATRVLRRHRIKRAPVLRDGRIVGMVTQSDLLRPYLRTDSEIKADVEEVLLEQQNGDSRISVRVQAGVVTLEGTVADVRRRILLLTLARSADGVVDVVDAMAWPEEVERRAG